MTFGEKIQKLRKEAGLSQEEFSYQLGVSRQAVSKWECDNGYPETEKIIRISKMFDVTLDYLLIEEDVQKTEFSSDENGLYVSMEMADGFLSYQKMKMQKIAFAVGIFIASLSLSYLDSDIGMIIFMLLLIIGVILLFSVKLADNPYRKLWKEALLFDKNVKAKLIADYSDHKKKTHILNLVGIALIAIGFLLFPLIAPTEWGTVDDILLGSGMIVAGIGAFLCVYMSGIVRAYRLLIMNEEYHEARK